MKFTLRHRPSTELVLLDAQRRPLAFTYKRLSVIQELAANMPEMPVFCYWDGQYKFVQLEMLELWNMRLIGMMNGTS